MTAEEYANKRVNDKDDSSYDSKAGMPIPYRGGMKALFISGAEYTSAGHCRIGKW